jgi:uncharacterized protein (DUF2147 family)
MRYLLLAPIAALTLSLPAHAADPINGQWLTANGNAIVTIAPCGKAVCGKISKVVRPDPNGDGTDRKNPDPALKSRKILGLMIIPNFTDAGKDWQGQIYSPEAGKSYKGYIVKQPDGSLQVRGCIATFLCQTQKWTAAR